jgi:predicted LPLAT superfamily acyltransferase
MLPRPARVIPSAAAWPRGVGALPSCMITVGISGGVVIGAVLLGAIVLAYLLGRRVGRRAERRRWEHRIAGQARKLGRARDVVRRALGKSGSAD